MGGGGGGGALQLRTHAELSIQHKTYFEPFSKDLKNVGGGGQK